MRVREQLRFCDNHQKETARREWSRLRYPIIAWDRLDDRLIQFDPRLHRMVRTEPRVLSSLRIVPDGPIAITKCGPAIGVWYLSVFGIWMRKDYGGSLCSLCLISSFRFTLLLLRRHYIYPGQHPHF
ncbi:hypothetical protein I7I53_09550 [Histoplasma capsulatum var. duboisii H88]|uniref:Uncharacterized protein n=1 Tax=Ajellomyces capsulatus (strain H88) TaxID=544711 RepID=A0A8A1L8X6_AJEC8|nr:hypothetical protein I7I53_09550 [Histoplasma capsulatum var. duboisii H88]